MTKKPKKKKKSLTTNELKALELVAKHPEKSNYAIGREMKELGVVKDDNYLVRRVSRSTGIADMIAIKREKNLLKIQNQMPLALKVSKSHLKNNNLKAAALVFKHALPTQDDAPIRQPMIHVETLNLIRGNQLLACQDKLDTIEVQESGNDNE